MGNLKNPECKLSAADSSGWKIVRLGEIAEVKLGKMLDKSKHQTGRKLPYLRNINVRWGSIDTDDVFEMHFEDDQIERYSLRAGDVLVCEGGEPGRAAVWNGQVAEMKFQKAIHRVRFNVPFEARLLVYLLESLAKSGGLERRFTGSTIKHFTREAFVQLPIPFPPEKEQRRIVAEIEKQFTRLAAGVAALRRVQANLKRYRAAVLKAACEGKLVENEVRMAKAEGRSVETGEQLLKRILVGRRKHWTGRGQYREPTAPETANLSENPKGWTWATLDSLVREPLRNGHSAKATGAGTGLRVFTLSAVTEGDFSERNTKHSVATPEKVADLWAEPGDIYVERANTPELVGIARLYKGPSRFAFIPDLFIRVRVASPVSERYVEICLLSERGRSFFRARAQGIAGNMPKIDQATVEAAPIPLPPLAEQTRIVAEVERRLSVVEELELVVSANLRRASSLRQSILRKAFAGELVEQKDSAHRE